MLALALDLEVPDEVQLLALGEQRQAGVLSPELAKPRPRQRSPAPREGSLRCGQRISQQSPREGLHLGRVDVVRAP
eukprot:878996-Alexandrium_andersonii.AAC.1